MLQISVYTFNHRHTLDLSARLPDKTSNISHDPFPLEPVLFVPLPPKSRSLLRSS